MNFVRVEKNGPVTTIVLDRPEVLNAVNPAMHVELQEAFDAFASAPDQLVCVVTGSGPKAFCAGSDLKAAARHGATTYPRNGYAGLIERFDLSKPVIAAVNGVALGGGFEIALACDVIVATDTASFGLPEPRVGAVALGGGLHRLVRQIGLKQAMGLILSARRVSAEEGLRLGFVNEVVPADQLAAAIDRWCAEILACAPLAISASKATAMRGLGERDVEAAMRAQHSWPEFQTWRVSEDLQEGPRAFAEKRLPQWKGR
jgi:enoyl-CoA hydratase/carnithine racemase